MRKLIFFREFKILDNSDDSIFFFEETK